MRPLKPDERLKIDAEGRKRGFLRVEPDKAGKDGLVRAGKNELREIVIAQTNCIRHNLDSLLLVPDIKEALRIVPAKGSKEAFQIVWGAFGPPTHDKETGVYRDDPLRRRFSIQLLRGKKDAPRSLTIAGIIAQLRSPSVVQKHPTAPEFAGRIDQATRRAASDKRGNPNEAKLTELMHAKFSCERLKGRARFGRHKLREAVQQVMQKENPLHPLEKNGCLEQTDAIKEASLQKALADLTNNHLVRHRLLILAGEQQAALCKKRKEGLLDHIIREFANGDKKLICRITIELARDLQTMSGLTNEEKAKELGGRVDHHRRVSEKLAGLLERERDENGNPIPITPGLIRKARIADDLGFHAEQKSWECPYTGRFFTAAHLVHRLYDKDHIIPRSQRLSDALEAMVITSKEVNAEKGKRTALQFVKDMNKPEKRAIRDRLSIRTEAQFREFVNCLRPKSDPFIRARTGGQKVTDDEARCWRRKQFLLTEKWEDKEFTPGDLTKTRHLVKLAAQQLERFFDDFPKERRPPIICINGAVTSAFRDKTWKLIRELAAVHPGVKTAAAEEQLAKAKGEDYNLKKKIRKITSLHHAVDAISLGLVTDLLVPPGHGSLNNELARLIIKAKLTAEEHQQFEALRHQLRLPKFYQWTAGGSVAADQNQAVASTRGVLCLNELPKPLKKEIQDRLKECRVAQHIPADQGTLDSDETLYRVFDPNDEHPTSQKLRRWFEQLLKSGELKKVKKLPDPNDSSEPLVLLVSRKRRGAGEKTSGKILHDTGQQRYWQYMLVGKDAVQGLSRKGEAGKLLAIKAGKPLGKNFGVIKITKNGRKPVFNIIRPCKAYAQLNVFRQENPDAQIDLIRRGTLIDLTEDDGTITRLRIFGSGERPGRGIYFDSAPPDALERIREIQISAFENGRAKILRSPLTGIPICPTTSSA
ncbi:MAG: type II CRISPR RNA-guided endonuclease Cas9 [Limisphaerales bacterium]